MGQVVVQGVVDAAALNLPREGRRSETKWGRGSYLKELVSHFTQYVNKAMRGRNSFRRHFEPHCLEQHLTRRKNPLSLFWRNLMALVAIWASEGEPVGPFTRSTSNGT